MDLEIDTHLRLRFRSLPRPYCVRTRRACGRVQRVAEATAWGWRLGSRAIPLDPIRHYRSSGWSSLGGVDISSRRGECSRLLTLLVLLRFEQKGHRDLCGRSRSYQGIWRKAKLRRGADSIRHPKIEVMASSREVKWKIRRDRGVVYFRSEVGTRNH
jgi:hypothetical protein